MTNTNNYNANDIKVLTDREHVRLRTQIYLGNMSKVSYEIPFFNNNKFRLDTVEFCPATLKACNEILDNSIDELIQNKNKIVKEIKIEANPLLGMYTISDNGRGIPIDMHETGRYTPEVALGSLRAGRNFADDKQSGVIGQNGVGSACTNYCCDEFNVDIYRDNMHYSQRFSNGASYISPPTIEPETYVETGTTINFQLDSTIFEDISLPNALMESRAMEIALTNPGLTTIYNGKKFKYRNGFDDIIKLMSKNYFKFEQDDMEFYVIFDLHTGIDEKMFSWVNSSLLFDGGICNTQFLNSFYDKVMEYLHKDAKKNKCELTKNDIRMNLLVIGNLKISDPQYDAQSKTRLTGPNLKKPITDILNDNWSTFSKKHKDWLQQILERAILRHHIDTEKKALKEHKKQSHKNIPGLVDATSKNRLECQILICEGDSAASCITNARNPKTTASLPLRGKINNVYGSTPAQLLQMGKVADLITAIGLTPGKKVVRSDLRYGKIIITSDSDYDGGDIFALLINLLYQYWPELFDKNYEPIVFRLVAPNVVAYNKTERIHFNTRQDYEGKKNKYKNWSITYMKGLGSMINKDWEMILNEQDSNLMPIVDDGKLKETLHMLFGPDSTLRKEWLQG
jgi:DNA gyrase/topoisomerase IV subunit B